MNAKVVDLLMRARAAICDSFRGEIASRPVDPNAPELRQYLMATMGSLPDEVLRVLFLDQGHRLIADEQVQQGSVGQLIVHPRAIFRRALEHNATAIILAHNHPSGDPTPSAEDVRATQLLDQIGHSLGIDLIDHLVVTAARVHHIVRALAPPHLSETVFTLRSPAPAVSDNELVLANIHRWMRRRTLRQQLLGSPELFGDPAWEMVLDVLVHECEGKDISISAMCITSGIPLSSALRLAQKLCAVGILRRDPDIFDGRRTFMRLDPAVSHKLRAYFSIEDD